MRFEFNSEIKQLEGKIKWSVFYFPYSAIEHFGSKGKIERFLFQSLLTDIYLNTCFYHRKMDII